MYKNTTTQIEPYMLWNKKYWNLSLARNYSVAETVLKIFVMVLKQPEFVTQKFKTVGMSLKFVDDVVLFNNSAVEVCLKLLYGGLSMFSPLLSPSWRVLAETNLYSHVYGISTNTMYTLGMKKRKFFCTRIGSKKYAEQVEIVCSTINVFDTIYAESFRSRFEIRTWVAHVTMFSFTKETLRLRFLQ